MTEAISLKTIRQEMYNQIPGLGLAGVADSVTTTTLVDPYAFGDTTLGNNHYRGFYIFRPDLSGDDRVKKVASNTGASGTLTIAGTNYVDTSELDYELVGALHPDEFNSCITRAQKRVLFDVQVPLCGPVTDGDMDANNTTSWTNTSLSTMEKVTTAQYVWSGFRSLHTVSASSAGYAKSVSIRVFANTTFFASCVVRVISGTASLLVYDETNSANVNTAVTSGESGWARLWVYGNVPTGCESVHLRLGCTEAAELYWNHALLYTSDRKQYPAPSYVDDQFKFHKLRQARYATTISNQTQGGYDAADSRTFMDWSQPQMFSLDPFQQDANPYTIQLLRAVPREELWIQARRPYSDTEPLSSETSTTRAPLELLYAYIKHEIAKLLVKRYPANASWQELMKEALAEIDSETTARPPTPRQPIKHEEDGWI